MDVAQALHGARARGVHALDAQLMLARLLGRPRAWLIAHDDAELDAAATEAYDAWLARRAAGEPLAYLFGEKEFHGLVLQVDRRVLVPRPDTETLVDWALGLLRGERPGTDAPAVVDLGTGSGAIALALARAAPAAQVTAVDASVGALQVASANAQNLGLSVTFAAGDWWEAVAGGRFDLAVSNPPYIEDDDPHLQALQHEPRAALAAGSDGLADLRRIVHGAATHLRPGAWLLLEHGWQQAAAVQALLERGGFECIETRRDLAGHPRCTGGRLGGG